MLDMKVTQAWRVEAHAGHQCFLFSLAVSPVGGLLPGFGGTSNSEGEGAAV